MPVDFPYLLIYIIGALTKGADGLEVGSPGFKPERGY
jgi:hypothetical protein